MSKKQLSSRQLAKEYVDRIWGDESKPRDSTGTELDFLAGWAARGQADRELVKEIPCDEPESLGCSTCNALLELDKLDEQ